MSLKTTIAKSWNIPSKLGDRLGWDWLTYNPGVYLEFAMVARRNAPLFAESVTRVVPDAESFVDVGAGTGQFVGALRRRGKAADGFEYSPVGRAFARVAGTPLRPFDLGDDDPLPGAATYDVAFSLEVGEHLPTEMSGAFVDALTRLAPTVVLTCAQPGQSGHGHINCQPKAFWKERFEARGYPHDDETYDRLHADLGRHPRLSGFITDNLMVFQRQGGGRAAT
ncbi:class I SAM-dependent methyltransferase [Rubrivirga sp.]|uniref:class I SAM-dependent methyltransferase n=1 Tax=Rubrivirga sp. TaxID=1885344 RepID=UPI003B51E4CF